MVIVGNICVNDVSHFLEHLIILQFVAYNYFQKEGKLDEFDEKGS